MAEGKQLTEEESNFSNEDADYVNQWVAYESYVEYRSWIETSSNGFKVQLTLPHRDHLKAFDGVMARRKGHAGHRYRIMVSGEHLDTRTMECQFWGRGWSESRGTHIALHFIENDVWWWKKLPTRDQGDSETPGKSMYIILMELGDDDQIVNQELLRQAEARAVEGLERGMLMESRKAAEDKGEAPVKGGPKSINAARLLRDADFNLWLNTHSIYKKFGPFTTYEDAHEFVLSRLEMDSFKQFDQSEFYWGEFEVNFKRPFRGWLGE